MHKYSSILKYKFFLTVVLLLLVLLSGCATVNYKQPVASFQQSVNTASVAIGSYYTNLNTFERQLYLEEIALDPTKEVWAEKNHMRTPLIGGYFDAKSIKARMDALSLLGVYAQRLTDLAGSNAPEQFSNQMNSLGENLINLNKTFSGLSGVSDKTASSYVGPVSQLIGSIGKMYLEKKRDAAIREAIDNGAPKVNIILGLLEKDLVESIKPLQTTGLEQQLSEKVEYYNDNRKSMNLQERRAFLTEIQSSAAAYDAAIAFNPSSLVQSMRQAMNALVKYADSSKTPQNFNDLLTSLEIFSQNAQEINVEVQKIRKVAKGD